VAKIEAQQPTDIRPAKSPESEFASEKSAEIASDFSPEFTSENPGEKSGFFASEKPKQGQQTQPVTL